MLVKKSLIPLLTLIGSVLFGQNLTDTTVFSYIKSVQIAPIGEPLDFAAYELGSKKGLELSFDDLAYEWNNYAYRIFHCTKNWEKSDLLLNQYLTGFEGNYMNDFAISIGTFVPYTHYSLKIPNADMTPRISGNYVIEVYQDDNPNDIVLRRRFIIYENLVIPALQVSRAVDLKDFSSEQQVSSRVSLSGYPVQDYFNDLDLSILQNRRWDNAKTELKPAFINDGLLEYNFMGGEAFPGGVEFHVFDTKRLNQVGMGVKTSRLDTCWEVYLNEVKNQSISVYSFQNDINGRRFYQRADAGNPDLAGDYCWVEFYFESTKLDVPVFVFGQLSDWRLTDEFELVYNEIRGAYSKSVLLKQGYYNYIFAHPTAGGSVGTELTEGTHWQTRNDYTLIMYNQGMGLRYDRIIGYLKPSSAL